MTIGSGVFKLGTKVDLGGIPVDVFSFDGLCSELDEAVRNRAKKVLVFANQNFIVRCQKMADRFWDGSVVVVNDGVALNVASLIFRGNRFPENLNGTDFFPAFLRRKDVAYRVFLVGAKPDVVRRAGEYVSRELGQQVVGVIDGFEGLRDDGAVVDEINKANPDVLLVALGNPRQEEWIFAHRDRLDVPVISGIGALFDFWAGDKVRAPLFVRKIRLEWAFRLAQEPRRLLKRYTIDVLHFFWICS